MLHDRSRQAVMLCKYNRRLCVLKEVGLTDDNSRRLFENEVNLLWKLQHPAIITVEAVSPASLSSSLLQELLSVPFGVNVPN